MIGTDGPCLRSPGERRLRSFPGIAAAPRARRRRPAGRLGGRAFDVLVALIEARGAVVGKDALMARVWPDRIVEENNLQAQISALRAAFGAERELIRTIAGRGYQFTGEIRPLASSLDARAIAAAAAAERATVTPPTNLAEPVSELIGRHDELRDILNLAAAHRLVTLTGAGGIGKTRLGLEAARRLLANNADGVWLVEFAPLSDADLVPVAVATALGLELASGMASPHSVASALRSKQLILVLDNCEHVVEAAARMAEPLLRANPAARVIATSREPLRAEGEWVYPVPPLAIPTAGSPDGEDPLRYGAVRLFVERARAATPYFSPDASAVAKIVQICRRLDGIPLAIELAAARAAALGVEGVAARLDNRFRLLAGGRRTALPRHQTLRATLDWSYELLTEPERAVLRRLAIFAGGFTLEAARAVAADGAVAAPEVVDCVASLVAKSLLAADAGVVRLRYRLLETTRAYLAEKLVQAGEFDAAARRHARRYLDLFAGAEADLETRPTDEWLADYGPRMDNLRAALDWAFSPDGDASLAVALTAAAVPLWTHLSLMDECRYRVEQALAGLTQRGDRDKRREMQLSAALGAALMYTRGVTSETRAAFAQALELADGLDDIDYRLRGLWGLWVDRMNDGAVRDAKRLAERFHLLASSSADPIAVPIGERTIGFALHFLGDQVKARRHIERMFSFQVPALHDRPIIRFQFDPWLTAQMRLAVIFWLQGQPDLAAHAVERGIDDALSLNHAVTLCNAFAQGACPIALLTGDLEAAERSVTMLHDHAERSGLGFWQADARCFEGVLLLRRGDVVQGLDILRNALDEFSGAMSHTRYDAFLAELAEAHGRLGDALRGLAVLDRALDRSERTGGRWYVPELLRIRGELLLLEGAAGAAVAAEDHYRRSLDCARSQGALSWELRAATSLARLLRDQGRSADATALLRPVYDRFTEGFGTSDLKTAKALLDAHAEPAALRARVS
jgi:predicted ATPase/DNA-binding winged helix-turn-helix (wHTH) protein